MDNSDYRLDPNDEFERVLIEMVSVHREKSAHYGEEGADSLWNFYHGAQVTGTHPLRQAWALMAKHISATTRWMSGSDQKSLPAPTAYSDDALLHDLPVYAVIVAMLYKRYTHPEQP